MNTRELLRTRLHIQKLDSPGFTTPAEMVRYFGAVQAQDYYGALWAVGQRVVGANETTIEAAIADRSIVRSWPMRGTLHFTAPEDLRWMLDLLSARIAHKAWPTIKSVGLTKKDLVKSRAIVERELEGGKIVERQELYDILNRNRISTTNTRGLHITGQLARDKVICLGPRKGKQPTFVLLDDWIPEKKTLTREESLAELASRYFVSHGPATVYDLAWWAGLTITEAGRALEMAKSQLQNVGDNHWMTRDIVAPPSRKPSFAEGLRKTRTIRLLPAYDEFLVGYSHTRTSETRAIFAANVVVNGQVVCGWQRTISSKGVTIKTDKQSVPGIRKEMKRYAKFIDKKLLNK